MGILKNYSQDLDGKKEWVRDTLGKSINAAFGQLVAQYRSGKMTVWENPKGLSPQEVMDALGSDAASLFRVSAVIGSAINALNPGTVDLAPPAGYSVQINQDGTVLITGPSA